MASSYRNYWDLDVVLERAKLTLDCYQAAESKAVTVEILIDDLAVLYAAAATAAERAHSEGTPSSLPHSQPREGDSGEHRNHKDEKP